MTGFEVRQATHRDMMVLSMSLTAEFSGRVPAGTVIRCVAQAREQLLASGVRAGLVAAVESMTRTRLELLAPTEGTSTAATPDEPALAVIDEANVR